MNMEKDTNTPYSDYIFNFEKPILKCKELSPEEYDEAYFTTCVSSKDRLQKDMVPHFVYKWGKYNEVIDTKVQLYQNKIPQQNKVTITHIDDAVDCLDQNYSVNLTTSITTDGTAQRDDTSDVISMSLSLDEFDDFGDGDADDIDDIDDDN